MTPLAILPPSPGLIRRFALGHARANLERFIERLMLEHASQSWTSEQPMPDESATDAADMLRRRELDIQHAERGLIESSLNACEMMSDGVRALPVYCAEVVCLAALAFAAADLRAGVPARIGIHDCPSTFKPWTPHQLADACDAEAARLKAGGFSGLRW